MSGNKKNDSKDDGGFGLGGAFLVGAGAAALGFLARDLWKSYQEFQGQSSSSSSNGQRPSGPPPPPATNWETKTDEHLGKRKKQREAFRDQPIIPEEMKCIVCYDNPKEVLLVPCGHVCLCEDCAEKITDKCPMCQQKIVNKKAIYI